VRTCRIGIVAGIYPGVWALTQIWTGHLSDRLGRKPLIIAGMLLQAAGLGLLAVSSGACRRATVVGVYRFWRDMGYVVGGLVAGLAADAIDYGGAIAVVAGLTAASGLWVALDLPAHPPARTNQRGASPQALTGNVAVDG
jgi:MFS family permease